MKLWTVVFDDPHGVMRKYGEMWRKLREKGETYYFKVRDDFNRRQDPCLFFFLLRTCRTGLVRFNQVGEFNSGFHDARPGMSPERVGARSLTGDGDLTGRTFISSQGIIER